MLGSGLFGSAPVPKLSKKTRVQLKYREKRRICEVQSLNPQWTQDRISQYASKEFGKSIGRALVSKILKEGERWNSLPDNKGGRTRNGPARHVQLEDGLFIANFVAQSACLGDEDLLQVQRLANKLLAMQATSVMNRKQKEIKSFFR